MFHISVFAVFFNVSMCFYFVEYFTVGSLVLTGCSTNIPEGFIPDGEGVFLFKHVM